MKKYLLSVAAIFVMFFNAVMAGVLPLSTCEVLPTMDQIMEIREIFFAMRSSVQLQDKHIDLQMLELSSMENIPSSDRCCFLQRLLHFYVTKVFSHYSLLDAQHRPVASKIANSFCALSRDSVPCRFTMNCNCGDVTMNHLRTIESNFKKLTLSKAVRKAFGELDILLDWMENLL